MSKGSHNGDRQPRSEIMEEIFTEFQRAGTRPDTVARIYRAWCMDDKDDLKKVIELLRNCQTVCWHLQRLLASMQD
jgi:hypothetical protein